MSDALDQTLQQAMAQGLLPNNAVRPEQEDRPWPVVLLTALGAWLAAVPLLIVVGTLLGDLIVRSAGPYLVGLLVLTGAVVVLRARSVPLFVEQLAVPALLVGGGSLGFGVFRDLPWRGAAGLLAAVALAVAAGVARPWLRLLLGSTAAALIGAVLLPEHMFGRGRDGYEGFWLAGHALLVLWAMALWSQRTTLEHGALARDAATLESVFAGWLLVVLAGMASLAGMTFLVSGATGGNWAGELAHELAPNGRGGYALETQIGSALLAGVAAAWPARAWPLARQPAALGLAVVGVLLAWLLPSLGAVLLVLAVTVTTHRWRLASAAGAAAAWIVGSFYYQLAWPLATKALLLVAAGALLGTVAWWMHRRSAPVAAGAPVTGPRLDRSATLIALGTLATIAVAATGVWQKEGLIARGQPVYVELAPVDPRSLMQGDYMRLNFRVPQVLDESISRWSTPRRPYVVVRKDERGVASLLRIDQGTPLAPGEFRVQLTPKNGRWVFVSDAWFFKEGDAQRWAKAKYGEFRVAGDGQALLVGMADADLKSIAAE